MRPLAQIAVAALLLALAPAQLRAEKPSIIYDNNGGFAYGGWRLELYGYGSGKFVSTVYDDTERRASTTGTYEKTGDVITLTDKNGKRLFHIVLFDHGEYLLRDDTFQQYAKSKDLHLLYAAARRQD